VNVENGPDGEHDGPAADAARVLHNPTQESHKRIGNMQIAIQPAGADESDEIAPLVGELLGEIMAAIGEQAFIFSLGEATVLLRELLDQGKYLVLVARTEAGQIAGFVSMYESFALYAQGAFGTIAEFYVRPEFRSQGIGQRLAERAKEFGRTRGWRRLEVTTPPLPHFGRTVGFYERGGFSVTGGRKLKFLL
jgi:GNAT superfamily N-acetyltransferase